MGVGETRAAPAAAGRQKGETDVRLGQLLNAWGKVRGTAPGVASVAADGRAAVHGLKEQYLSAIDVFRDLPKSEMERLAKLTRMVTTPRGRTIYRAGDASDTLFL